MHEDEDERLKIEDAYIAVVIATAPQRANLTELLLLLLLLLDYFLEKALTVLKQSTQAFIYTFSNQNAFESKTEGRHQSATTTAKLQNSLSDTSWAVERSDCQGIRVGSQTRRIASRLWFVEKGEATSQGHTVLPTVHARN